MQQNETSCIRCVGGIKICSYCDGRLIVHGKTNSGKTRYKCKNCHKTQVGYYAYRAYHKNVNHQITQFIKEGLGIRSISRVLKISTTTLLRRIIAIAKRTMLPIIIKGRSYEVDELRTFVKRKDKLIWIVYALERASRQVVTFSVGGRTNKTLNVVLKTLTLSDARRIYTDKLINYRYLVDHFIHRTDVYCTNHIERKNLTLRTHLKRLNRRTICFSRSIAMLHACLMIYFFG